MTPSLEDEEVLLGWEDIYVELGFLRKGFNVLRDEDMWGKVSRSVVSAFSSPVTVSTVKQGVKSMEEQLQELKAEVLEEF